MIVKWRWIKGYKGLYKISTKGDIKSVDRKVVYSDGRVGLFKSQIIRPGKDFCGYLGVGLTKNKKRKMHKVHHLVLETFIGPRPEGTECRHFPDRNPTNNCLDNLRWGTHNQNVQDRIRHGTSKIVPRGGIHYRSKLTDKKVIRIRKLRFKGSTLQSVANKFGLCIATVHAIVRNQTWTHI